jgi:hypothetical protein
MRQVHVAWLRCRWTVLSLGSDRGAKLQDQTAAGSGSVTFVGSVSSSGSVHDQAAP